MPQTVSTAEIQQFHNVLNDMAVSTIQGNLEAYNEAKHRLHVLMK